MVFLQLWCEILIGALHTYWLLQHQTCCLLMHVSHFLLQLHFLMDIRSLLCSGCCLFLLLEHNHEALLDDKQCIFCKLVFVVSFLHCDLKSYVLDIHSKVLLFLIFWSSHSKASPWLIHTFLEDVSSGKPHIIQGMLFCYYLLW